MNILDKIVAHKRIEVAAQKQKVSVSELEQRPLFSAAPVSMKGSITQSDLTGIIAEYKRKSPSKGLINGTATVQDTTQGYARAGASALSVLTDEEFFGGNVEDLMHARSVNTLPIIRKDFTIDEYQIIEAKSIGANAILLIAAILTPEQSKSFVQVAHALGLEVLLEVHDEEELLAHRDIGADMIGVNNRNLKTFEVSIEVSKRLASLIPNGVVKVSESGISDVNTILELRKYGYEGFLIGENFMKQSDPSQAAWDFMSSLRNTNSKA
jgi:indole-3-glycerol phosphate synthase